MKKTWHTVIIAAVSCLFNIVFNIILIPLIGPKGAAISTGLSYCLFFILRTYFSNKYFHLNIRPIKITIITILMIVFALYNTYNKINLISVTLYLISLVAIFVLKAGFEISKETLNNLLDGTLPIEDIETIKEIIKTYNNSCLRGFKNLKARRSGPLKDIEITMLFPKDMTISECHKICDEIESLLKQRLGNCDILIHAEPDGCKDK